MALGTTLKQPETAQLVAMIRKAPCFATCGQKRPPFAAFAGLKSRAKVAILLLGQNIRSIFARTHTERVLRHDHKTKRCQAEAGSIRLSEVPSAMRRWPSTASTPNTSPLPNAGAYKSPKGLSSGMRSPCCVCSSGGQAEADTNRLSAVPHTSVYGQEQIQASQGVALTESAQAEADSIRISLVPHTSVCGHHLAVVSEAMLRLASLLRTDHMLGGAQSSAFIKQLNLVLKEISDESALDER